MSEELKLVYFNIKGLGETIRITLRDNKIDFIDKEVTLEEWPELKPRMTFGQLPCLYDGRKQIVQSDAIMRHIARRYDLYGSPDEMVWVDQFYDQGKDVLTKLKRMIYNEYERKDEIIKTVLPEELGKLEKHIRGKQYFVGNKPTIADYSIFYLLECVNALAPHVLDQFPSLKSFHDSFASRPNLKPYIESDEYKNKPFTVTGRLREVMRFALRDNKIDLGRRSKNGRKAGARNGKKGDCTNAALPEELEKHIKGEQRFVGSKAAIADYSIFNHLQQTLAVALDRL